MNIAHHPFPHSVTDGWWDTDLLNDVLGEFPKPEVPGWRRYESGNERKLEGPKGLWGPRTRELFELIRDRTPILEKAFNIPDLTMETIGGGYHCIAPGGYLKVHTDFSVSPRSNLYRRLNLLIYLNHDWDDQGGRLELWDDNGMAKSITPEFNRTLVFATSDHSWHGHPKPAQRWRRSVAAYFFSPEPPEGFDGAHSTVWWPRAS